jgi:hypothetical protein
MHLGIIWIHVPSLFQDEIGPIDFEPLPGKEETYPAFQSRERKIPNPQHQQHHGDACLSFVALRPTKIRDLNPLQKGIFCIPQCQ